jgi:hypothetical protein
MKRVLVLSAVALLASAPGCKSKVELDHTVDGMVGALSKCDHSALDKQIAPALATELDEKFDGMCKVVQWFGPLEERNQTGISVSRGQSTGTYDLTFEKGQLALELVLTDGEITMFKFSGDDWAKAEVALEAERFAEYKVYAFDWLDKDGSPHAGGNKYASGGINYRVLVGGIEAKDGKFNLSLTTRILDSQGEKLWESPQPDTMSFDQDQRGGGRSGTVNGAVTIPRPGTFRIELDIEDENSGKTTSYTEAVVVEG